MILNPKYTFEGIDANLEVSLMEYDMICSVEEHEDGSGTHAVIYDNDYGYDIGHISEKQVNGYILGEEFPDEELIASFLKCHGTTKDEWLARSFVIKLHDLISYWKSENILGTSYNAFTQEEVLEALHVYFNTKTNPDKHNAEENN